MKRRLLSMLAALALGASALAVGVPAASADGHLGAPYVALGDSEAAGTGNMPYVDQQCLRSKKSYPLLLAGGFGGVDSRACAGADTTDVLGQAAMADLGLATQLVTITAGVNNLDWQAVLAACSSGGTPTDCLEAQAGIPAALATIPGGIAQLLGAVRAAAPNAMIVVTGYPELFGTVTDSCSVGAFQGAPVKFTAQQTMAVNQGIALVNQAIQAGIAAYQAAFTGQFGSADPAVTYVDVAAVFDGHGLCDTGDRWISGLASGKPVADRGFHPNVSGQQALAAAIAGALPQ
ncbi:MAG TPA: SGNH/GDSL hydrolase family protein [Microbacterium sp.]|nr:SGNH/GDSL hydrolase family protein [Microbacterium sp.]